MSEHARRTKTVFDAVTALMAGASAVFRPGDVTAHLRALAQHLSGAEGAPRAHQLAAVGIDRARRRLRDMVACKRCILLRRGSKVAGENG